MTQMIDLSGLWQCQADIDGDGRMRTYPCQLPGTLDENCIGYPDTAAASIHPDAGAGGRTMQAGGLIATRLTRRVTYEGPVRFVRRLTYRPEPEQRVFFEVERARCLRVYVNGQEAPRFGGWSLSTPQVFELTGLLTGGDTLTVESDNSYPGLPRADILASSAATDETQTNWNGLLGYLRLRLEERVFSTYVRVYPDSGLHTLTVVLSLASGSDWNGTATVRSPALAQSHIYSAQQTSRVHALAFRGLPLAENIHLWDEKEGNLYPLTVELSNGSTKTVFFGVRHFAAAQGRLTLNGRKIFLRGETNCAVFPETGHPPMDTNAWREILRVYQTYGVNCVRFHSWCPPQAAFAAADELGMLLQPELSCWDPHDAFEDGESRTYFQLELEQILTVYANHPSFVMMTLGNELQAGKRGRANMDHLLALARALDGTRLYANGSNVHYGQHGCDTASDFYTAFGYRGADLRATFANMEGALNRSYPSAAANYNMTMERLRESYAGPVFSFEAGQFEVLPHFTQIDGYRGVTRPDNLCLIQQKVEAQGLAERWDAYVEATGELALLGYRAEVEAALRTGELSGISLLGLQDFPGQGTALVGMLDAHLRPKPYSFAQPERFAAFFTDQLPLILLPRYTYETGETLVAPVVIANYGKYPLQGAVHYELCGPGVMIKGDFPPVAAICGGLTVVGELCLPLETIRRNVRLTLSVELAGIRNQYPLWVYRPVKPRCPDGVYETRRLDAATKKVLAENGTVYLSPPSTWEAIPRSIQAQFTTDFWSVGTFPGQSGAMGQLIDADHPLFADFPTETHTDWQWWPMAVQRAFILPQPWRAVITEMDSYAYLRPMAQIVECRCGGGKLLLSSLGLQDLQQYIECRALQDCIYRYLGSPHFDPPQEITLREIETLFTP